MSDKDIIDQMRRALAEAERRGYERGVSDTLERITAAARAPAATAQRDDPPPAAKKRRAPKGAVREFVMRVLSEHPGLTPSEITEYAATDDEQAIQPSSIRGELRAGKEAGRYETKGGRWFPAQTEKAEDAMQSNPSAFVFGTSEGR